MSCIIKSYRWFEIINESKELQMQMRTAINGLEEHKKKLWLTCEWAIDERDK